MLETLLCPDQSEDPGLLSPIREVVSVRSANDLREAVLRARGRIRCLDTSGLDRILCVDEPRGLVEVQAGVRWDMLAVHPGESLDRCRTHLRAWAADPASPATVGNCISLNAPGPDGRLVAAHVESITLVMADGQLRRASRDVDPELFRAAVGGFGVCGIPYSATLRIASLAGCPPHAGPGIGHADLVLNLPAERADAFLRIAELELASFRIAIAGCSARHVVVEEPVFLGSGPAELLRIELALSSETTLSGRVRLADACTRIIAAAIGHGGRFALEAARHASCEQAEACYPMLRRFFDEKLRHDRNERLQNAWYRHYRNLLRRGAVDARAAA